MVSPSSETSIISPLPLPLPALVLPLVLAAFLLLVLLFAEAAVTVVKPWHVLPDIGLDPLLK
jgi:hypothetical protein